MSLAKPETSIWICIPINLIEPAVNGVLREKPDDTEALKFVAYADGRRRKEIRRIGPRFIQETFPWNR